MEGKRFTMVRGSMNSTRKSRKVIEIDSFEKYEKYKERYGYGLELKTMSSPVLKQFIKETKLEELNLSGLCYDQNLDLDDFMQLFDRNRTEKIFSARSLFYYYFDGNKATDDDYIRLVKFFVDNSVGEDSYELSSSFASHSYATIVFNNKISYEVVKESLIYAIDTWLAVPTEEFEDAGGNGNENWILSLNNFVNEISDAIKTTYVIPAKDQDFVVDYLFGGKIVETDKARYFDRRFLGAPYNSVHESFFNKELIGRLYDQVLSSFGANSFYTEASNFNPYMNSRYYEAIEEVITLEEIERILEKIGQGKREYIMGAVFESTAEIDDKTIAKHMDEVSIEKLIKNKCVCNWIDRKGLTDKYFEQILEAGSMAYQRPSHNLGFLNLTKEQIKQYLDESSVPSYDKIYLKYANLEKLEIDEIGKHLDRIEVDLYSVEDVTKIPLDLMVLFLRHDYSSKRAILNHKSITKENPIPLAATRRFIDEQSSGLRAVYTDTMYGSYYELDDEIIGKIIDEMGELDEEYKFISKMDGSINDLINLFSEKELV